jgi:hypothetical protein
MLTFIAVRTPEIKHVQYNEMSTTAAFVPVMYQRVNFDVLNSLTSPCLLLYITTILAWEIMASF